MPATSSSTVPSQTPLTCPLCSNPAEAMPVVSFYSCSNCHGVFRHPDFYLSAADERHQYTLHQNDIHDVRYRNFVSPITSAIISRYSTNSRGLDFGAGPGPVIAQVLQELGYSISLYDPYFYPQPEVLGVQYDFIACCEVIEHFHHPALEFQALRRLLLPKGVLFIMTHLFQPETDFASWYYIKDPTHVFFYTSQTMEWVQQTFGFSDIEIHGRLILLTA